MQASYFSLLSWNILGPSTRDVEHFGFALGDYTRLGAVLKVIESYQADLICLQEVDHVSLRFFNNYFLDRYHLVSYQSKGAHGGVVVYAKRSQFDFMTSWGGRLRGYNSKSPGACAGGVLIHKQSNVSLCVGSIHISRSHDHRSVLIGHHQWEELAFHIGDMIPERVILAGDCNTLYEEMHQDTVQLLREIFKKPFEMFAHRSCTSNTPQGHFSSVDHVLYAHMKLIDSDSKVHAREYVYERITTAFSSIDIENLMPIQQIVPSDHLPVFAVFESPQKIERVDTKVSTRAHLHGRSLKAT